MVHLIALNGCISRLLSMTNAYIHAAVCALFEKLVTAVELRFFSSFFGSSGDVFGVIGATVAPPCRK